jgi:hypothetical protein
MGSAVIRATEWTKATPSEVGIYWNWQGDPNSGPVPIFVQYSGHTGKYFVSMGQLGLTHSIDCDVYGGLWAPAHHPPVPGICEHGIMEGDWCEPCNKEYKRAAREHGYDR